jgi:acetolactate synthase-1/2/3 large subunit
MLEKLAELASTLRGAGVEHAFGVTGSGPSLHLIGAMEDLGVHYHPVSHEAAAAIMAGGAARLEGRPAVSLSIRGPGFLNQLPGIALNSFETAPAVSISEAMGPDVPAHRRHKRIDQHALVAPLTKGRASLSQLDGVASLLAVAAAEVPGPVHIQLCDDRDGVSGIKRPPPCDPHAEALALQAIGRAERPVVIAGSLALRRPWGRRLENCDGPIFTTVAGKGAVDESLPQAAGVYTGVGRELSPESGLFQHADLVVGLGLRNSEVLLASPFDTPTVLIDEVAGTHHAGFEAETIVVSPDAAPFDRALDALAGKGGATPALAPLITRMLSDLHAAGDWLPATIFESLNEVTSDQALVLDTGDFCTVGEHVWRARPTRPFLGSSNSRFMGASIPTAIGAAIARPGLPVFCAVGDGGVRMYPAEIRLAVAERLPVCFVLMTDGRFASVANVAGPTASARALEIDGPSWWRGVEALGCDAVAVGSRAELEQAVGAWSRDGPLFLEARFDQADYAGMANGLR